MTTSARCIAILLGLLSATGSGAAEPAAQFAPAQGNFILGCAGCHGLTGVSNSTLVPSLKGLVGYYLNVPDGRAYLSRLPNVAFSTFNDRELAAVLNYMVFNIGAGSAPAGARPYSAAEVGKWRKQPLTEVTLSAYRKKLVETLISSYQAPAEMRGYSAAATQ